MRLRWTPIEGLCGEIAELSGGRHICWIESADGEVVAGQSPNKTRKTSRIPLVVGEIEVGLACCYGRESERWASVLAMVVSRELSSQATVGDMADATARLWKHTNALMRMAACAKLASGPGEILSNILGLVDRSTHMKKGVGVVSFDGGTTYTVFDGDASREIDALDVAPLFSVNEEVRLITTADTTDGLVAACADITGDYGHAAVARLATENEDLGFVIAPVDRHEEVTSEEFKVLASAGQIISVALENVKILSKHMEAAKLQVQNELLATQNADMEELLHVVAHDLRSPMTALYGFVHVALDELRDLRTKLEEEGFAIGAQSDVIAEPLRDAGRSVEKLNRMVQRLMEFSRSARGAYTFEKVELGKLVQGVVRSLRFQITKKEIETNIGLLPTVNADRAQLEAVFSNLIDNSIKYMGEAEGPHSISIGCQSGDELVYFVSDTGVGMSADQVEKAFLPFQRFHSAAAPGDGIGLPHVRKIIERHGGKIWCESEEGVGTTFYFTMGPEATASRLQRPREETPPTEDSGSSEMTF
jgi:signal transduction histidine kinase